MNYELAIRWMKEIGSGDWLTKSDDQSHVGIWAGDIPVRILSKLCKAGLVEFQEHEPFDKPSEFIEVSDFGSEVLKAYEVKERVEQEAREHREILNINLGTDGI